MAESPTVAQTDTVEARRRAELAEMRRVLPPSAPWTAWQEKTGELPPDFASLPSDPELPDPLVRERDGKQVAVRTSAEWEARRRELQALFQQWVFGHVPPPPDNLRATVLDEHREDGATVRHVRLAFGPGHKATLRMELLIPDGKGPFPVFMTQHNHRGWALVALRRGYIGCVYAGADSQDDTDTFVAAYPECDWSRLMRRGWAGSRCLDYLQTVPQADSRRVAIAGHSRNGKTSLMASAMDDRFAAVISSSSGAGGSVPARFSAGPQYAESIEQITRVFPDWFSPRFRFFANHEDRLPVDMNELVALSAPRACLISTALNDGVELTWAIQQTYLSARRVYQTLGHPERLRILWRAGSHETQAATAERYVDWCDAQFGRGRYDFPESFVYPYDWSAWNKRRGVPPLGKDAPPHPALPTDRAAWEARRTAVRTAVRTMLGEEPRAVGPAAGYGSEPAHVASLLGRPAPSGGVEKVAVAFGDYLSGDVYMPAGLRQSGKMAPAVLWLHPFSFPGGYIGAYVGSDDTPNSQIHLALARAGYVVFCFDQIGCGRRVEEAETFYERYPNWSLLGCMVRDSRAALDVLEGLPYVDRRHVAALGYSLGALVGLQLAALDDRVTELVAVGPPIPFRLDTPERGTGGIARWSHRYMILPQLGRFVGHEDRVPYDLDDLIACAAPRPVTVVAPRIDRETPADAIAAMVAAPRAVYTMYGAADALTLDTPDDFNHLGPRMQRHAVAVLNRLNGR